MADLSRTRARETRQDRPVDRREGIIPSRRNTEAPQRQVNADMRSAQRGDVGGAEQLRRIFGGAEDAASSFKAYADQRFQEESNANTAQGAIDEAAGKVDEAKMAKSAAYRSSVTDGRTKSSWYKHLRDIDEGARAIIEKQTSADPAEREAELDAYFDQQFRGYALNEDGTVKDFGSPETTRWLAGEIQRNRATMRDGAMAAVEKRMNEEAIDNSVATIQSRIRAGLSVDVEEAMAMLPPTADRKAAKEALVAGVMEIAAETEESDPARAEAIVRGLLNAPRGPSAAALEDEGTIAEVAIPASVVAPAVPLFEGFASARVSSGMGAKRASGAHNGEDFPMAVGTQLRAPMDATVEKVWTNERGGRQVLLRLANGDTLGVAHLSVQSVSQGDKITAGTVFGLSGNTGRSSGPHAHVTVRKGGKTAVAASEYLGSLQQATSEGAPMAPKVPGEGEFGVDTAGLEVGGAYALNRSERLRVREYLNGMQTRIKSREERKKAEAQDEAAGGLLDRINGIGAYPTKKEILDARRNDQIDASQAASLLGQIEADENRALAQEDRRLAAIDRAERREEKNAATRAQRLVEKFMGPVYGGNLSVPDASRRLLELAPTISDPDVRRSVVGTVRAELGAIVDVRQQTPAYIDTQERLDRMEAGMIAQLPAQLSGSRGPFPGGRKRAEQLIKNYVNQQRTRLGRAAMGDGDLNAMSKSVDADAKAWLGQQFGGYIRR
ncbi:M23 family metallopeptidase [Sphingomonas sp.]|uniref:M23 family metallopeptidase n=1 Tax=Sphingomonas sp. TaxID=28214 RepID=UPI002EDA95CB